MLDTITDIVSDIIEDTAQECILPYFRHLKAGDITTKKSPNDYVTVADIKAEQYLSQRLKKLVPGSVVLGEEAAFKNPKVFESLCYPDTTVWIIDPLDGTKNFIKGQSIFGIIVSMVINGETVAGWINIPLHKNVMIAGEKGSGVWSQGIKLCTTSFNKELCRMKGSLSIEIPSLNEKIRSKLWWGSAAFSYAMLLTRNIHFAIYRTHPLQPWDHAAGVFLHKEAGGVSGFIDGSQYRPFPIDSTLILAPDEEIWQELAHTVKADAAP